jgi:hypothetical protein
MEAQARQDRSLRIGKHFPVDAFVYFPDAGENN